MAVAAVVVSVELALELPRDHDDNIGTRILTIAAKGMTEAFLVLAVLRLYLAFLEVRRVPSPQLGQEDPDQPIAQHPVLKSVSTPALQLLPEPSQESP